MSRHGESTQEESAHDVLAAEEFGMGTGDPQLHVEPPHDVLAAEEFGMGTGDPTLRHDHPLTLPEEPTGASPEPHDVLAAEEFAVPAGHVGAGGPGAAGPADRGSAVTATGRGAGRRSRLLAAGAVAALVSLGALVRGRRR